MTSASLLDKEDLRTRVNRRLRPYGTPVSSAQFDDWKREHLLPEGVAAPRSGRGRPRLLYPARTEEVLFWLAQHRRFIDGDDVARLWLWLEGYDHINVDVAAVFRSRLEAWWHRFQEEALPSLLDLATVATQGIPATLTDTLLGEFDERVSQPMNQSGAWTDQQTSLASVAALLLSIPLPFALEDGPVAEDETAPAADIADSLLMPEADDALRAQLATQVPRLLLAGKLVELYRMVTSPTFTPNGVRQTWLMLTPETIPLFWPALGQVALIPHDARQPKDRAEFMRRFFGYDPLRFLFFGVVMVAALETITGAAATLDTTREAEKGGIPDSVR